MKIVDGNGQDVPIDGETMVKLLRMAWNIGCSHGAQKAQEIIGIGPYDNVTVLIVNASLQESWQNEKWCKNFVKKIYSIAMGKEEQ